MHDSTRNTLQRVIEKATTLRNSRFIAHLLDKPYRVDFTPESPTVTKPDDEARDAFLLNFRFFIMRNEPTSFGSLTDLLDNDELSTEWKDRFRELRTAVNQYLATIYGQYKYEGTTHKFTNREIMETFLYGGLVHANDPVAVARYEEWKRHPYLYAIFEMWFVSIMQTMMIGIAALARLCGGELQTSD